MVKVLLLSMFTLFAGSAHANTAWAAIRAVDRSFDFQDVDTADAELGISDLTGRVIYHLKCHSGSYDVHPDDADEYSGLLQCYLKSSAPGESALNLLADSAEQAADWTNRQI